jgi:cytochrome P450
VNTRYDSQMTQPDQVSDDWIENHFDVHSHDLSLDLHGVLGRARTMCPVLHSDQYDGYWITTRFEDVLRVAQDWENFSSELGITVPHVPASASSPTMKILPVAVDPPLQRTFKRLINRHFTPAVVTPWEPATRALVNRLVDGFIERGECDFMAEFARPFPGLAFFDLALHAPPDDLEQVNDWATLASMPQRPESRDAMMSLAGWIAQLVARRREEGPRGDVVDAVMEAEIEGRPISDAELIGVIQLLVLGGLETTAGVLGAVMLRFCEQPEIPELLRAQPELIPAAVEELLRLDGSFVAIGRTARHDAEVAGQQIQAGERIIMYWAAANRDESEFPDADRFDLDRTSNRHIAFGAGPHRCAGSNLARMNLRIALEVLVNRVTDVKLASGAEIDWHTAFNRAPISVPITFTPGAVR